MYNFLIVGAGIFGATLAHQLNSHNKRVMVIDRRNHIAGNIYTKRQNGIDVHQYGAHIFHTDNEQVWNFANRFTQFHHYVHTVTANYKGEIYNLPFNMNTFNKLWGVVTPEQAKAKIAEQSGTVSNPKNLEEQAISLVGLDIYEKLIQGYTEKQWGRQCKDLPSFIIKRLPVRFTYDNRYFNNRYQGIPIDGYTAMVENMLASIEVRLNTAYTADMAKLAEKVIYTGAIDEYFGYQLGELEYRGLRFKIETHPVENYQGCAVMNYTDAQTPYTRIHEHKHFTNAISDNTIITYEYPAAWKRGDEPYYPVNDEKNNALYVRYQELAVKESHVLFGGRLGSYKYFDMDKVMEEALKLAEELL